MFFASMFSVHTKIMTLQNLKKSLKQIAKILWKIRLFANTLKVCIYSSDIVDINADGSKNIDIIVHVCFCDALHVVK